MALQLAASVFLIVVAGLVATNARSIQQARLGFDPEPLVAIRGTMDGGALAAALEDEPDVVAVSATSSIPFMHPMFGARVLRDGRSDGIRVRFVDSRWWSLLGLPVLAGRGFAPADEASTPSAIVSRRAAELLWPGRSPLGQTMRLQSDGRDGPALDRSVEVVGMAADHATGWLFGDPDRAVVYLPAAAGTAEAPVLLLRLRDASAARLLELQRECRRVDPNASCQPLRLTDALRVQRVPFTVASVLSNALAWLALAISCVGLYGLVSYAVVQQRHALGIRMALGARGRDVVAHVMRGAVRPLAAGLLAGLLLAWGLSRLLAHLTELLRTFSIDAFVTYPLVLVAIALLASWLPARRSARIPPGECMRVEH